MKVKLHKLSCKLPRRLRRILCKLNIHLSFDWSYDPYHGTTKCVYCGRTKKV